MTQEEIISAIKQVYDRLPCGRTVIGTQVFHLSWRTTSATVCHRFVNLISGPSWEVTFVDYVDNFTHATVMDKTTVVLKETDPGAFERDFVLIMLGLDER